MNNSKFLQTDRLIAMTHRGGAGEAAENTLKAFRNTVDVGFDYIELDVWADAKGELFIWHGSLLDFFRGNTTQVLDHGPDSNAPHLSTVLDALPTVRFIIEPKHSLAIEPLAQIVAERQLIDRICVSGASFGRTLQVARLVREKCGKKLCIGMPGLITIRSLMPRACIAPSASWEAPAAVAFAPHRLVSRRMVEAAHSSGLKLVADVVNDPRDMYRLLGLRVDGIMTDFPSRLKQVLRSWDQS